MKIKTYQFKAGLIIFLLNFLISSIFAQVPQKMSFQAVIRNNSNALITSTLVGMKISVLQGSPTGTVAYSETQSPTTNANGLVSLQIGTGAFISGTFTAINWANGPYFIKTETDPTGGNAYSIIGISELTSVPYALFCANATPGPAGPIHFIGELFGGGIVVSVYKIVGIEHGLIASLTDLSSGIPWATPTYTSLSVAGGATDPVNGLANSNAIVADLGAGNTYAAGLCRASTAGGFNDWYLPAAFELQDCMNAASIITNILGNSNGMYLANPVGNNGLINCYWSSTEAYSNGAWYQATSVLYLGAWFTNKNRTHRVRAVRRF